MLAGLKVASLVCKCVFCELEHNAMGGTLEINFEGLQNTKMKYMYQWIY